MTSITDRTGMRVLDPHTSGDVATLGQELRRLRRCRGLSQQRMALLLGLSSHSAVADYERGKRIPANDITIAYEREFSLTGRELQVLRARELHRTASTEHRTASTEHRTEAPTDPSRSDETTTVPPSAAGPATGRAQVAGVAPRPLWRRRPTRRTTAVGGACAVAVVVLSWTVFARVTADQPPRRAVGLWAPGVLTQHSGDRAESSSQPEDMDGDDPRARGCNGDVATLQTVPLRLPDGSPFGSLLLRRSGSCGTEWGSARYSNPHLYTVRITARRPADGAVVSSDWSNNTPPGSYGDMLSTAPGCVTVQAVVVTPLGTSTPDSTTCLR